MGFRDKAREWAIALTAVRAISGELSEAQAQELPNKPGEVEVDKNTDKSDTESPIEKTEQDAELQEQRYELYEEIRSKFFQYFLGNLRGVATSDRGAEAHKRTQEALAGLYDDVYESKKFDADAIQKKWAARLDQTKLAYEDEIKKREQWSALHRELTSPFYYFYSETLGSDNLFSVMPDLSGKIWQDIQAENADLEQVKAKWKAEFERIKAEHDARKKVEGIPD